MLRLWLCLFVFVGVAVSNAAQALEYEDYPLVKLRSLDKITARTMTYEAKVGSTLKFGDLFIKIQACRKPPPVEKTEAAAFLQIWQQNDQAPKKEAAQSAWIYSGWMFASSPSLSAMDHPVYDVWVVDCTGRDPEPVPVVEEPKPEPESQEEAITPDPTAESTSESTPGSTPEPAPAVDIPSETEAGGAPEPQVAPELEPALESEPFVQPLAPREEEKPAPPSPSFEGIY